MTKKYKLSDNNLVINDLFPQVGKNYESIDNSHQLNKIRYDYIQSLYNQGLDIFIEKIYTIEDIRLFAKMSADIINDHNDILTLIKHLNYCVYKFNDEKFNHNFSKFMRAFIESKIISYGSYSIVDLSNLPINSRALYLSILPYRLYLSHESSNENELDNLYWQCFTIDSSIKLVDLEYIIPKLLKIKNYSQIKNVIAYTFNETGIITVENLKIFMESLSNINDSNISDKSSDHYMLLEMFDYVNKSINDEMILIDLEVYLLKIIKEREYYFNYPVILGRAFRESSKFILLYEQAYGIKNSEDSKYLINILFNNMKGVFRFNHFYVNQETFVEWYKSLTYLSKDKPYNEDLNYLLGLIALKFTLKDDNIPNYEMLELLDSIDNPNFVRGYSDHQIITVLNDIKANKLFNAPYNNIDFDLKEKFELASYDLSIKSRITELEKIMVLAQLAGYYNAADSMKKAKKILDDYLNEIYTKEDSAINLKFEDQLIGKFDDYIKFT